VGGGTLLLALLWFLVLLLSKGMVDLKLVLLVYCCLWNIQVGGVASMMMVLTFYWIHA